MRLAQHEEVIQARAAEGADDPFGEGVLPGCAGGGEDLTNSHALDSPRELLAVDRVSITEQEPGSRIVRECLDDLPGGPDSRGVVRDVDMEEVAAVVAEHDEEEEQTKREGRDEEEVDDHDISGMRGEKRAPRGRRSRRRPMHVPRDREFGDAVAEQGQFRPDAPAVPGGFSRAMRRMRWRSLGSSLGRPTEEALDLHRQ